MVGIAVEFMLHKNGRTMLIKNAEEQASTLHEYTFVCKAKMKNDKFIQPFTKRVQSLTAKMESMKRLLDLIDNVQRVWLLLHDVFATKEVQVLMKNVFVEYRRETALFEGKMKIFSIVS